MSGGTDSSVAAMLLSQSGYEVLGITFLFREDISDESAVNDAAGLCSDLGIPHLVYDARLVFREKIISYFTDEYLSGRTPFPCAKCNNELKWNLIFEQADKAGCDFVSMGHYANIVSENGKYFISAGKDPDKDQSFFLWGLRQEQLSRILFPLGGYHKSETREYARQNGFLKFSNKKDSLGACFCPGDYRSFLKSKLTDPEEIIYPGNFTDEAGNILGRHQGFPMYTVGQRRGLGLQLNKAVFVKEIIPEKNEVVLAPLKNMYRTSFEIKDYNIADPALFGNEFDTITRIRYRKQNTLSRISIKDRYTIKIELAEPLESIAPGQTAVFYRDGKVLGGGFII